MSDQLQPVPQGTASDRPSRATTTTGSPGPSLFRRDIMVPATVLLLLAAAAIFAPYLAPYGPFERTQDAAGDLNRLLSPSWEHPFGTTNLGRDVLSQVLWGARRSLALGSLAAIAAVLVGVNVGLIAGYLRGPVDNLLMRITDVAYAIPFLPFAIVLVGIFGRTDAVLVAAIASLFWRTTARIIRAQILTLRERPFVHAAHATGASGFRIVYVHLLPNVLPIALLYAVLLVAEAIVAEASLSFLGLSSVDSVSLGTIMFDAYTAGLVATAWWWTFFPGLLIMISVLTISVLGRAIEARQLTQIGAG